MYHGARRTQRENFQKSNGESGRWYGLSRLAGAPLAPSSDRVARSTYPHAMTKTATVPSPADCRHPPVPAVETFLTLPDADLIARYRKGVENFDRRLFWLTECQIDQAFLPEANVGQWPVRVLLGHLADAEIAFVARMRKAVAEERPVLQPWDEHAFIDSNIYGNAPHAPAGSAEADKARVASALGGFVAVVHTLRQWTGQWLGTLSDAQLAREAMHPERGVQSVKTILAYDTWHLEHHARFLKLKIDRILGEAAIRERAADDAAAAAGGSCGPGCGCYAKKG